MIYLIALFLHVSVAVILFATLGAEWLSIVNLGRAASTENIRLFTFTFSILKKLYSYSLLLILITGVYMMATVWKHGAWMVFGFIGMVLLGAIGGKATNKQVKLIEKGVTEQANSISTELSELINNNRLIYSICSRTAIALGIIFLMAVKPGLIVSILALLISTAIGFIPMLKRPAMYSQTNLNKL